MFMTRWTVVLDDDPTGTQGLSDVPVVVDPTHAAFEWALRQSHTTYVLTNTRALDPAATRSLLRQIVGLAAEVAQDAGRTLRFVSRGDSTLRGHFPLEVSTVLDADSDYRPAGCLLVPAFPDAGRVTLDGVHMVRVDGELIPVAESEYARDATFGYSDSELTTWAASRVPAEWVVSAIPSAVFDRGVADVAAMLLAVATFSVVCPSIRDDHDLAVLAQAQVLAEASGVEFVVQAGPAYPRHLAGFPFAPVVEAVLLSPHGIIAVGSHTTTTTNQLRCAKSRHDLVEVELDVAAVDDDRRPAEITRCTADIVDALATSSVLLSTSRERVTGSDAADSLRIANRIASALTEVTRGALKAKPGFLIAKGGITSRDAVAESLGWQAAMVVGPLVDQTLPVWKSWRAAPGDPLCVIFPGNVGSADLLARALDRLAQFTMNIPSSKDTPR